ncbi:hypothetical protein GS454_28465 [Rhodococcus hoagii]|nr:hypothetical protein [Prescottella equi]
MMTPPLSISAMPRLTRAVPVVGVVSGCSQPNSWGSRRLRERSDTPGPAEPVSDSWCHSAWPILWTTPPPPP